MKITLHIRRYQPGVDKEPYDRDYVVDAEPTERVLDAMMQVKRFQDGTLGFRKSCAHGVCGSDAMRINGKDRLACKTLIRDVVEKEGDIVTIEPLRHFPVKRDLIVDQTAFFEHYRAVSPFLINDVPPPSKERLQTQEERMAFDDATNCILCSACVSACPIPDDTPGFLGPAAIVQAFRFLADSRDKGVQVRLPVLDAPEGVWSCQNHFECTRCCPRSIKITKRINQTKDMIRRSRAGESSGDVEKGD
ncbi:MAG: succinate dehydrogenase iron-sulfur subunit [Deltaproteobacteria bacterium]|nr:succinate dehydrogenase iron-sulfur subunit [Deltaproteobacteria bacterium]